MILKKNTQSLTIKKVHLFICYLTYSYETAINYQYVEIFVCLAFSFLSEFPLERRYQ